ncbi:PREDICTED: LOC18784793 [Prunus dulcis]|uniref:PREDICTED: LOC18784793 n=1 Tax=Prunus dulcis TaxID=3755 RepID=A0A5E4E744_PRUDU|nr:hypothetical protein L3X38_006913 [Prunus dulcis]VVA11604.1 PREDICTED: LOC18784793 [Prunus dulcis]
MGPVKVVKSKENVYVVTLEDEVVDSWLLEDPWDTKEFVGEKIRLVMKVENFEEVGFKGFLRMRVDFDTFKPLPPSFSMPCPVMGYRKIHLKYEGLKDAICQRPIFKEQQLGLNPHEFGRVMMELDCKALIENIKDKSRCNDWSILPIIHQIRRLESQFNVLEWCWIPRNGNHTAHDRPPPSLVRVLVSDGLPSPP